MQVSFGESGALERWIAALAGRMVFPREYRAIPRPRTRPMKAPRPGLPTRSALGSPSRSGAGATPLPRAALRLALAACAAVAVAGCRPYVQGNGFYLEETRSPLPDFVGIHLENGIDATVTVGPAQSVVVSGDANVVKWITTEVRTDTVRGEPIQVLYVFVAQEYGATIPPRAVIKLPKLRYVRAIEDSFADVSAAAAETLVVEADASEVRVKGNGGENLYPTLHDAGLDAGSYPVSHVDLVLTGASRLDLRALSVVTGEAHGTSRVYNRLGTLGICGGVVVTESAQVFCN